MANSFGRDILLQTPDPKRAAEFYVNQLGFEVSDETEKRICLHGPRVNLFLEKGPALGPALEVTVDSVEAARVRLIRHGCTVVKDDPTYSRCYLRDPYGLIYSLLE
jgi:catechol 2,3-dioxygenase-like lactoylglutathione lyase family enzyme